MRGSMLYLLASGLCLDSALGWGKVGHYITAAIADNQLSEATRQLTRDILGQKSIADVWAWTSSLHFCDSSADECSVTYLTDCHNRYNHTGQCVMGAILNYTSVLKDTSPPTPAMLLLRHRSPLHMDAGAPDTAQDLNPHNLDVPELLSFLVHYVGDLHQPMHVGRKSDLGGNKIEVTFEGRKTELHEVWDDLILNKRVADDFGHDMLRYTKHLVDKASKPEGKALVESKCLERTVGCLVAWANESAYASCHYAYQPVKTSNALGDVYYKEVLPVIEERLIMGGLRLAKLLQDTWP